MLSVLKGIECIKIINEATKEIVAEISSDENHPVVSATGFLVVLMPSKT